MLKYIKNPCPDHLVKDVFGTKFTLMLVMAPRYVPWT
jgi:hypothetical protein